MNAEIGSSEHRDIEVLHEIGERIAAADPLSTVLKLVVEFVAAVVKCDSCFIYVLDGAELTLRASQNPHDEVVDHLKIRMGQGITGWVAENRRPVAIGENASLDPRFQAFHELPEDRYEAFLSVPILCRDKLVGVINAQHREPRQHSRREVHLISTIGFLVGPEIEMARLEAESMKSSELAEARRMVDEAQKVLARMLKVDEDEAYLVMQKESRERRESMKQVAEAVLLVEGIITARRQPRSAPQ